MNNCYIEEPKKYLDAMQKITYKCKCGHNVTIPVFVEKQICSWCGNYVYANPKEEFKDKLKVEMRKRK